MNFFDGLPFVSFWVLTGILTLRVFLLKKKGIQVSSKSGKKNKITRFLFPVFGLVFLLWLFEITKQAFQLSFLVLPDVFVKWLFGSIFLKVSGAVSIFLSLFFLTVTLVHFNTSLRFGLDESNRGKLVTTGVFSISRNPFFLSLDLYFLGIALIFPNLFFIGFTFLAFLGVHFFILKEEKFLRKVYGEAYEKYAEKVRRYF
ncbi:DUF1295 domain-containing protein [Maribellus comscasis]|uniref:DUF1295 domain-containing protein n=1 Tax=Maribellus comscasis TaxID=2681766 RepID=A0A6I6K2R5_9BACT|nr:isoprenylcysteine carboxylmethyltransferase family protein [Maribellus comscasis]QGY44204.1 DUF1295 domain-containing protein [Maribellus comscasis]